MTIREIIRRQHADQSVLFFVQQGMFYHAFNESAHFLHAATGYRIRTRYFPNGDTYELAGFPLSSIDHVIKNICRRSPKSEIEFCGSLVTLTNVRS